MSRIKKLFVKRIILTLLVAHFSLLGFASIYYVSNSGNDSNTGLTTSQAWASLAKVNASTFKPGDQILFQRGSTFYGSLTVKNSGTAGNPITFGAYGTGDKPVITGFTTVNSWTSLGNNIWESAKAVSTLSTCNMVTVNGVNTPMGRYPNADVANGGYLTFQSHSGKTSITSRDLNGSPNWTGAEVVIRSGHYLISRSTITSQSGSTLAFNALTNGACTDNFGYFIQNDVRTLDQQNEWYYNSITQKLRIYSIGQPLNVKVASVDKLAEIKGNYLIFDNITFTGSNSCNIYASDHSPLRYNNVSIRNCSLLYSGISTINTLINNLTIESNSIWESNSNAILISYTKGVLLKDNTIQNIGLFTGMRDTKSYYGTNSTIAADVVKRLTIEYNRILKVGYCGISFYGDTVLIKNNYIDTFCKVLDDGGGIYTYTGNDRAATNNVKIVGNILVNGIGAPEGTSGTFPSIAAGIYLDERTKNVEVYENSIANTAVVGINLNATAGYINVHNNTIYNASKYLYYSTYWNVQTPAINNIVFNNTFVAKTNTQICISFYFSGSNALLSTKLDNNYVSRPIDDFGSPLPNSKVIFINLPNWNDCFKTLEQWQSFSKQDANSHKSPISIKDENDLRFEYNDTKEPKIINIDLPMMDVKGTKYFGKLTLQPFTSVVLIKDSKTPLATTEYQTICEGSNYNGWTTNGKYERKLVDETGNYTLITTFLTVTPSQKVSENKSVKEGETYNGWNKSGTYTRKLSSVAGCDSIVTTNLQVAINTTKQADIESTQTIELVKGYNLISTYIVASNPDAIEVTKSLSNQNLLVKLQDEAGNSLENWGSYGGWINKLGDIENTEGYQIQVTNDCTLKVTGKSVSLPLAISLKMGWNIISFPYIDLVNAMNVIQPLIDQNLLVKVQDESGNSIEDWGLFGGWKNGIGNFMPGKAYKVQLKADARLTIQENYPKSAVILAQIEKREYFTTRIEGNGTDHININIAGLDHAGIAIGDELAAFDGDICVGSKKITEAILNSSSTSIIASYSTDDQHQNGFKADDPIQIYVWNKLSGEKSKVNGEVIQGHLNFEKNASVLINMKSLATVATSLGNATQIDVFPNPSNGLFTVRFSELPDMDSKIDILDISGRKIASRLVTQSSEVFNLEEQAPGLYLVKTTMDSKEKIHKIIIN